LRLGRVGGRAPGPVPLRDRTAHVQEMVKFHRVPCEAEHALVTLLGHLHDHPGLFVHRHRLTGHAIGTEDQPFAIGGPIRVGLVNLVVAKSGASRLVRKVSMVPVTGSGTTFFSDGKRVPICAQSDNGSRPGTSREQQRGKQDLSFHGVMAGSTGVRRKRFRGFAPASVSKAAPVSGGDSDKASRRGASWQRHSIRVLRSRLGVFTKGNEGNKESWCLRDHSRRFAGKLPILTPCLSCLSCVSW